MLRLPMAPAGFPRRYFTTKERPLHGFLRERPDHSNRSRHERGCARSEVVANSCTALVFEAVSGYCHSCRRATALRASSY